MKKGWQQIMLYLIVLTSYGVFLMKTNVSVSWCRGRYLPSKRFRLMFSNYYSRQRLVAVAFRRQWTISGKQQTRYMSLCVIRKKISSY